MNPIAFEIGPLTIRWYGVFTAVGFLAGLLLAQYRAGRSGFGRQNAADLAVAAIVGGIIGARILYVVKEWEYFSVNLTRIFRIDQGGLVFYGGFAGGALAVVFFCRLRKLSVLAAADIFAPALPLGHTFGRIGCFLNGCCFGRVWTRWGGVRYPLDSNVAFVQQQAGMALTPVFPIQLLEAFANLLLCLTLLRISRLMRYRGQLFYCYMMLYAGVRFLLEFGRGDYAEVQLTAGLFTPAQISCLIILPLAGVFFFNARKFPGSEMPGEKKQGKK